MNKLWIFCLLFVAMAVSVSAIDSGHLCDSVSDSGRFIVKAVLNPKYPCLVNGRSSECANGSHVELSGDSGSSFVPFQVSSAPPYLDSVVVSNDGRMIVAFATTLGGVYFSSDGGSVWRKISDSTMASACISSDKRVIVASGDGVVVSNDYGASFKTLKDSISEAGGFVFDDSTRRYMRFMPYSVSIGGSALALSDDGRVIMVGDYGSGQFGGLLWHSEDFGSRWTNFPASAIGLGHWNGLALSCDGSRAVALASGYTEYFTIDLTGHMLIYDNGVWRVANVPESYWTFLSMSCDGRMIVASGTKDVVYARGSVGTQATYRSSDGGSSWNSEAGLVNQVTGNVAYPIELSYVWTSRMVVGVLAIIVLSVLGIYLIFRPKSCIFI